MPTYTPVAPTYRVPKRLAVVSGVPLTKVLSVRVTRGWDQDVATGEISIPYPMPSNVGNRSPIRIYLGADTPILRFTGFVTSIGTQVWPGRIVLGCEDMLALAKYYKPGAIMDLEGMTDQEAVTTILTAVGIPYTSDLIGGTGKVIGTDSDANPALRWDASASALQKIQEIDQISVFETGDGYQGIYRTYCDPGGMIRRIPLHPLPASTPAHTFEEGVDIEQGSLRIEAVEPTNLATARGGLGLSVTLAGSNPFATLSNPVVGSYPMLETVDGSGTVLDLNGQVRYLLQHNTGNFVRLDIQVRRDDLIGAYETDRIVSPHSIIDILALVQSVTTDLPESGGFSQQISFISYRELNIADDEIPQFDPITGDDITDDMGDFPDLGVGGDQELPEPIDEEAITASFNINQIDKETVLVDGSYSDLFTVSCEDTSVALVSEIVSWSWEAGGGGTPASGTDPRFTVSWAGSLSGATVTLTVTDALGNTASTPAIAITQSSGVPTRTRKLYTAETDKFAAFDGSTWRQQAASAAVVVANGPHWGQSDDVYSTADELATAPTSSTPISTYDVTSVWVERDVSTLKIAAGLDAGQVAISEDGGATWTEAGPLSVADEPVIQVILSRDNPDQIWALQPSAISLSYDSGGTWTLLRSAATGQEFIALRLSPWRNLVSSTVSGEGAVLEKAEDASAAFTFPDTPDGITGVAFNVYADEVLAVSGDTPPKVYVTQEAGSYTMVAAPVPDLSGYADAAPYPRNVQHDGSNARMVYVAAGDWALKSTDFFKADTVHVLRHVGEGGAGAGPIVMIGMGDLGQAVTAAGGTRLYVIADDGRVFKSTDGAVSWTELTQVPGGGSQFSFTVEAGSPDILHAWSFVTGYQISTDGGSSWSAGTLPTFTGRFLITGPNGSGSLYVSGSHVSTDHGASWSAIPNSGFYEYVTAGKLWSGFDDTQISRMNLDGTSQELIALSSGDWPSGPSCRGSSDSFGLAFGRNNTSPDTVGLEKIVGTTATDITPPSLLITDPSIGGNPIMDALSNDGGTTILCTIPQQDSSEANYGQLWLSTNGGSSWTKVKEDPQLVAEFGGLGFQIVYDPSMTTTWWVLGGNKFSDTPNPPNDPAVVWTSTDNGANWASTVVDAGVYELDGIVLVAD